MNSDEEISDEARAALMAAEHEALVSSLEAHLKWVALLQAKLEIRTIYCTVQANRDVVVSSVFDGQGMTAIPYARISWPTGKLARIGSLEPPSPPEPIT